MTVQGAKVYQADFKRHHPGIDDLDAVAMAACSMANNPSAVNRVARELGLTPADAQATLANFQRAAERLYVEKRPHGQLRQPPWSVGRALAEAEREDDRRAVLAKVSQETVFINEMWHEGMKATFSAYVAHYLHVFLEQFESLGKFKTKSREEQIRYIELLAKEVARFNLAMGSLPQNDRRYNELYCQAFASQFMCYLTTALAEDDAELQAKVGPFLRAHAVSGWALGTAGASLPDCLRGPQSNWTR